ncbi:MAG: RsmB/NOP family class I SAM-dependent RNA methyltransferase [Deltaproteobacteria bacterium]|nr:RsmB/NOP family class I SAM-dependent RNA methyltransferase [Deltaproteobacteria bacterium]
MTVAHPLPGRPTARLLDAAGALFLAGVRGRAPLDAVVATFLRGRHELRGAERGFVVDVAQGMWRVRRRLELAARGLSAEPTRGALACLYLVGARRLPPSELPIDPAGGRGLAEAWRATDGAPDDVRLGVPSWLLQRFVDERGGEAARALCATFAEAPPTTLRANRLRTDPDALVRALAEEGVVARRAALAPDGVVLEFRAELFSTRAFTAGLFEVQDEGSQLVSLLCGAAPGMTVVDGCAGAGGKTLHLAAQMGGKGTLYALEPHERRRHDLSRRAARAGVHNLRVGDVDKKARLAGRADVVLVDAPCSGTGVLRRNPDTAWSLTVDDVARLATQQRAILEGYAPLVRPGGRLVYATCSLLTEENERVVEGFLARYPAFVAVDAGAVLAAHGVSLPGEFLSVDSARHGTDGFFGAVLLAR